MTTRRLTAPRLAVLCVLLLGSALATPARAQDIHPVNQAALDAAGAGKVMTGGAIIDNGIVQLGVHDQGHLNVPGGTLSAGGSGTGGNGRPGTTVVGLRYLPNGTEATAPGCKCEGWGVADRLTGAWGGANEDRGGVQNLNVVSFVSDGMSATSVVEVPGVYRVTHAYAPSGVTPLLYEVLVTIENISTQPRDVEYRRTMDWDIENTPFAEMVTIQGAAAASNVLEFSDDGFRSPNPLGWIGRIRFANEDRVDDGPADHGANFDFVFGVLDPGETLSFTTFYGAAPDEADALSAIAAESIEVYSLGQTSYGATTGQMNTFIFGFKGVGGTASCDPVDYTPLGIVGNRTIAFTLEHPDGVVEVDFTNLDGFDPALTTNDAGMTSVDGGTIWTASSPGVSPVTFELRVPSGVKEGSYMARVTSDCGSIVNIDPVVDFGDAEAAGGFELEANYPNPFNPTTRIAFVLPEDGMTRLEIYDALGRLVREVVAAELTAGRHTFEWDGRDASGQAVPSGAYFYRVASGTFQAVRQMHLVK